MSYIERYLNETALVIKNLQANEPRFEKAIKLLKKTRKSEGRVFVLGVGGSAANSSHCVNDLRKIAGIESYAPVDNVAELTAWTNDNGFEFVFSKWLETSKLNKKDMIIIFSVGGGSETTSKNLVEAMKLAKKRGAKILSIVSRTGGYAKQVSDVCFHIPVYSEDLITPHAEGFQGIVWHLLVNALR